MLMAASVALDGGIAKGNECDRETSTAADISVDTGSDAADYPSGIPAGT